MANPIVFGRRGRYPKGDFKSLAADAWLTFFELAPPECDLAHWAIKADGGTVVVSARRSSTWEGDPDWDAPASIIMLVEGIIETFNRQDKSCWANVRSDFQAWVALGILESLKPAKVIRKFTSFLASHKTFGIVTSPTDEGLAYDDLSLIWSKDDRLTVSKIVARQLAAKKPKKKGALRKTRVSKTKRK